MLFRTSSGNFGDDLNGWLWPRLAPEVCDPAEPALFLGIGTILTRSIAREPVKVVFGSGCGGKPGPALDFKWHFYAVRGPRTAAKLGLDPALAICDPAILVRRVCPASPARSYPVAFMPHYQSLGEADWPALCARAGIHFINARSPVDQVLAEIQKSELLLAEAMHGAIVADALRVPWVPVRLYGHFLEYKWRDWTEALELPMKLVDVPPVFEHRLASRKGLRQSGKKLLASIGLGKAKWKNLHFRPSGEREIDACLRALEQAARTAAPGLSADKILHEREARLLEQLSRLREDWTQGKFRPGSRPAASPASA